jgi:hypothetical protein
MRGLLCNWQGFFPTNQQLTFAHSIIERGQRIFWRTRLTRAVGSECPAVAGADKQIAICPPFDGTSEMRADRRQYVKCLWLVPIALHPEKRLVFLCFRVLFPVGRERDQLPLAGRKALESGDGVKRRQEPRHADPPSQRRIDRSCRDECYAECRHNGESLAAKGQEPSTWRGRWRSFGSMWCLHREFRRLFGSGIFVAADWLVAVYRARGPKQTRDRGMTSIAQRHRVKAQEGYPLPRTIDVRRVRCVARVPADWARGRGSL